MKIKDLQRDDHNFNRGRDEGRKLMQQSLEQFGAGRSILVDKDNRIIAGNKTAEAALAVGLEDAVIIETTGDELVAVKRTDIVLNSRDGRELALADNATQQANFAWDEKELMAMDARFGLAFQDWKVPAIKAAGSGGADALPTSGGEASTPAGEQENVIKELVVKFASDEFSFVLKKLRALGETPEEGMLRALNLIPEKDETE